MKISDFQPLATEPAIFRVKWDALREADIGAKRPDGTKFVAKYGKLRQTLLDEGVIECNWHGAFPKILTSKGEYTLVKVDHTLVDDWATESVWLLLCFDCHLVTRLDSDINGVSWFFYERSDEDLLTRDAFFVVREGKIVDEAFAIYTGPPDTNFDPSRKLLDAGVWERFDPGQPDRDPPNRSHGPEWRVGWARAAYKHFYETTRTGRAYVMSPRAIRFDDLHFWVEDDTTPEPTPSELAKQIQAISSRLSSLDGLVKIALAIAIALTIGRWLSK
jgi:hypothetical protein